MSAKIQNSSCYAFDIRNSTNFIRKSLETNDADFLWYHSKFMIDIYYELENQIEKLEIQESYINDTGDGHICLIQDENHALLILKLACSMALFIKKEMERYNYKYAISRKLETNEKIEEINFGIGIHSDIGCIVQQGAKLFGYGNAINTASKVETATKLFKNRRILLTGDFRRNLPNNITKFELVAKGLDIKDWGSKGHSLYSIDERDWENVSKL